MQLQLLWRVMGTGAILYTHIVGDHQLITCGRCCVFSHFLSIYLILIYHKCYYACQGASRLCCRRVTVTPSSFRPVGSLFPFGSRFDEAITDFLHVIRTKIPSPYTFGDIMTHIAWCYELKGDAIDSKLIRDEAKGAFATAFQSLTEKVRVYPCMPSFLFVLPLHARGRASTATHRQRLQAHDSCC